MKEDIDRLMGSEGLDAILILGPARHNPDMYYFTGGGHVSSGALLLRRGQPGLLHCYPMERDEAALSGLQVKFFAPIADLLEQTDGDLLEAEAMQVQQLLEGAGVTSGRLAIGGISDLGPILGIIPVLSKALPDLTISGLPRDSVIREAMATKDGDEIERIRRMGSITTEVVDNIADFLSGHHAREGVLVNGGGRVLTIGDVKHRINRELVERGAENPHGSIFAAGRDAGVPHSAGADASPVPAGETIVFDIFPCEEGGGYFYDFTRTWCLGNAPDEALSLYQDVIEVYQEVVSKLEPDALCEPYQDLTCELFEARGHPTVRTDSYTNDGYTHSLGHGLGLYVHELPHFGQLATEKDVLAPGAVFTIEPGLYYPERGMGVRLENTYHVGKDGVIGPLAEYPLDLVLPLSQ
ncbi:MAG: Xaa-Pro peptidase family protein [Anaerolineales bacterium]|nr:Xaa-Pro peptidase family protein [Anaerolineales bacterium]